MDAAEFEERLARARRGDRHALGDALDAIEEPLARAARHSLHGGLRTRFETADILQSTYLDIVRGIANFRGSDRTSFASWVSTILRNNIVDKMRRQQRRGRTTTSSLTEGGVPAHDATPSVAAVQSEQLRAVGDALERLPPDQRQAVTLRMLQNWEYPAIAARLQRSEGATRMLVARARASLAMHVDRRLGSEAQ